MQSSALVRQRERPQKAAGEIYLKFQLCPETLAVFSMHYVQEALTLPSRQLTPMPNMPACMLGLMNRRSHVFWVVDLAKLLGIPAPDMALHQYNLVLIRANSIPLGLAVHQTEGITRLDMRDIQPPLEQLSPNIIPYLSGCLLQQQDVLLVLDAIAIVRSPIFQSS